MAWLNPKPGPGIYRKYAVKRLRDKEGKHRHCDYFVLDWNHDRFAVAAARAYAMACESEYPELAADLRVRASEAEAMWARLGPGPGVPS